MQISELETLAVGCGDIARGFKKLRSVFLLWSRKGVPGTKNPRSQLRETPPSSPPTELFSDGETACWKDCIEEWLVSNRCPWGPRHNHHVAEFVLGKRWRGDNFKNIWEYVGPRIGLNPTYGNISEKKNWRTRSLRSFEGLFDEYVQHLYESSNWLKSNCAENTSLWKNIHRRKKARLDNVVNSKPITIKQFTRILKDNHKEFPKLRG